MTKIERVFLIFFCTIYLIFCTFLMTEYWMPQKIQKVYISYAENIYISQKPYRINIPYDRIYKSICNSNIHNKEFTLCNDLLFDKDIVGYDINFLEIRKNRYGVEGIILSGNFYEKNSEIRYPVLTDDTYISYTLNYHRRLSIGVRLSMIIFFVIIVFNLNRLRE